MVVVVLGGGGGDGGGGVRGRRAKGQRSRSGHEGETRVDDG